MIRSSMASAVLAIFVLVVSWIGGGCFLSAAASQYDGMSEAELLLSFRDMVNDTTNSCLQLATWPATAAGNASDHCSWLGVVCGGSTGQEVQGLNLSNCLLQQVDGAQSEAFAPLCSLPNLTSLDLTNNNFYGSFPGALLNCSKLRHLGLSANLLVGGLPEGIGERLTELELLDLSMNNFTGGANISTWGGLRKLRYLYLQGNLLDGALPEGIGLPRSLEVLALAYNPFPAQRAEVVLPRLVANLTELRELWMTKCALSGSLPEEILRTPNLANLDLARNSITGSIPAEFLSGLSSLNMLLLYDNLLDGPIPPSALSNLTSLTHLDISMNRLSGPFPPTLPFPNLLSFHAYQNLFSGPFPPSLSSFPSLSEITLFSNNFSGPLPPDLGLSSSAAGFVAFDVSDNGFTGPLPPHLCRGGSLIFLNAKFNFLDGTLPPEYGNCSRLQRLRLNQNNLSGSVPDGLWAVPSLFILQLDHNDFEGSIGASQIASARNLSILRLDNNRFSGVVPAELGSLPNLTVLSLSRNRFSGNIPPQIGELRHLSELHLDHNNLTGEIPSSLASCSELAILDLSDNVLSGSIPASLGNLSAIDTLNLSHNQLTGHIPERLSDLRLTNLDLSYNLLTGPVPSAFLNSAFDDSFVGNADLCGDNLVGILPCSSSSSSHNMSASSDGGGLRSSKLFLAVLLAATFGLAFLLLVVGLRYAYRISLHRRRPPMDVVLGTDPKSAERFSSSSSSWGQNLIDASCWGGTPASSMSNIMIKSGSRKEHHQHPNVLIWEELRRQQMGSNNDPWTVICFHKVQYSEYDIIRSLGETGEAIGGGRSGTVYKARLRNGDKVVAVKKIQVVEEEDGKTVPNDKGFGAEVATLGKIRHKNIVKLLCCCSNKSIKLLVYEYMPNGSLGDLLHSCYDGVVPPPTESSGGDDDNDDKSDTTGRRRRVRQLDWPTRYRISVDAAQGLSYLHHDCSPPIVHRDIKSNNILLDHNLNACIADFGVAKQLPPPPVFRDHDPAGRWPAGGLSSSSSTSSSVAGSYGYIAPEHAYTAKVTEKSDVYSFGVVLLELVTGKKAVINDGGTASACTDIVRWTRDRLSGNNNIGGDGEEQGEAPPPVSAAAQARWVLDPLLLNPDQYDVAAGCTTTPWLESMAKVLRIAMICTSSLPLQRPSMREVLRLLKDAAPEAATPAADNNAKNQRAKQKTDHGSFEATKEEMQWGKMQYG